MVSHCHVGRQTNTHAPTTPNLQPLPGITQIRFSLLRFRSPLLSESLLFSLPTGTEMFHFPAFPPHTLYIQARVTGHDSSWVSPFGHPRINVRLPTPQGLSQAPTSFIGSRCQGIHHVPFIACRLPTQHNKQTPHTPPAPHHPTGDRTTGDMCGSYKDARVHYPDLNQQPHTTHSPHHRGTTAWPGTRNSNPPPHTGASGPSDFSGPNSVPDR